MRYEIKREFAPYIGVSWTRLGGRTADYARADGHDTSERAIVIGIKTWL
ncbi:MAG: copper resistance protein B [Sphingobium sp.]|nr:copper resistance protein B [Sphingobium sp.]